MPDLVPDSVADLTAPRRRLPVWVAPVADFAVLVLFVAIGRSSHHGPSGAGYFLRVLWPFALALLLGYAATRLVRAPLAWRRVAGTWAITTAVAEALRLGVQDRPWKPAFLVVATLFIGACMFGWRLVAARCYATSAVQNSENTST